MLGHEPGELHVLLCCVGPRLADRERGAVSSLRRAEANENLDSRPSSIQHMPIRPRRLVDGGTERLSSPRLNAAIFTSAFSGTRKRTGSNESQCGSALRDSCLE
jgi:hypothetical protein